MLLSNRYIFFASANRLPQDGQTGLRPEVVVVCIVRVNQNPGGSACQRGFMPCVVASFPADSVCQYFCCKLSPGCHKQLVDCGTL